MGKSHSDGVGRGGHTVGVDKGPLEWVEEGHSVGFGRGRYVGVGRGGHTVGVGRFTLLVREEEVT